jgi:hypothetical protein
MNNMRNQFFRNRWLSSAIQVLICATLIGCQSVTAFSSTAIPTLIPIIIAPTKTIPLLQATEISPYPPPILGMTFSPESTNKSTPSPIPSQPTNSKPTITPSVEIYPTNQEYYPKCTLEGLYFRCQDSILGMGFIYPTRWGQLTAILSRGSCGEKGYAYSYNFTSFLEAEAVGHSPDFCKPMGAGYFSFYNGIAPNAGCEYFRGAQECHQINDQVVLATLFPDFRSLCSPGPGLLLQPLMAIGINIPGSHKVNGLVFTIDFLSIKGKDSLFGPLGGQYIDTEKCRDPKNEQRYVQLVQEISQKVQQNSFDEETSYKVDEIIEMANSITFIP